TVAQPQTGGRAIPPLPKLHPGANLTLIPAIAGTVDSRSFSPTGHGKPSQPPEAIQESTGFVIEWCTPQDAGASAQHLASERLGSALRLGERASPGFRRCSAVCNREAVRSCCARATFRRCDGDGS